MSGNGKNPALVAALETIVGSAYVLIDPLETQRRRDGIAPWQRSDCRGGRADRLRWIGSIGGAA